MTGSAHITRAQRRAIKKLSNEVDRTIEGDRRFFERHASRSYRIRLASSAEMVSLAQLEPVRELDLGDRWFVAVRQVAPGMRLRAYFTGPAENETDAPEEWCRWFYERVKPPGGCAIERKLEEAAAKRGDQ